MREDDVIIKLITNNLIMNSYNLIILIKETPILLKTWELIVTPFIILIKGAKKRQKPLIIFKAS